ncbi:hypothetical protein GURASL_13600 [Geotalea uraniireducens]|uniref:Uncharacterized protein n=1 Tax=Geotalea uraniireducens TaxID=351604 RepID=A0ABN6VSP9_9BACT|nr:Gp37 family protein [Geotalea uraniireducens]BDV42437.1 hypothetical protein GURASL_13600 [Geotalea uraniireducens]
MDFLTLIEDSIIDRLRAKLPGILVQPYPDNPESYEPTHPVGALLVRYSDADYSDSRDTATVVQDRDMHWEITLAMWSLRGKAGGKGLYAYLEAGRVALTGFKPPHCRLKMTPVTEGFVNRTASGLKNKAQRLWQYQITFRTQGLNIELVDEEQEVLLRHITSINVTSDITTEVP